jgi:hypothetical protein
MHTGERPDARRKAVTFKEVLTQLIDWLQQDKRLSYRALKRQFTLDDDYLDDLAAAVLVDSAAQIRHALAGMADHDTPA